MHSILYFVTEIKKNLMITNWRYIMRLRNINRQNAIRCTLSGDLCAIIMQAQVKEWGNSQGIRLPKEVLKSAGIAVNDVFEYI